MEKTNVVNQKASVCRKVISEPIKQNIRHYGAFTTAAVAAASLVDWWVNNAYQNSGCIQANSFLHFCVTTDGINTGTIRTIHGDKLVLK
jgi:hypothetical protein